MNKRAILKISRPILSEVLNRDRLFRDLDNAIERPLTWIAAPAGSGKTTLLASHLDTGSVNYIWYNMDEHDSDVANFFHYMGQAAHQTVGFNFQNHPGFLPSTRQGLNYYCKNFFEKVYSLVSPPFIFIIDDYPGFGEDSEILDVMTGAFEIAPPGISFVILSRFMPPFRLARFQAGRKMKLLTWDDIRFTRNETVNLIKLLAPERKVPLSDKLLDKLDGWATGVVLETVATRFIPVAEATEVQESSKNFAYFASEVLARLEEETRSFLLRSAFLPWMTVDMSVRLTGNPDANRILFSMHTRCCFTERIDGTVSAYKYHPLFREFLLNNVYLTFSPSEIRSLEQTAASLLEEAGAIEESAEIYLHNKSWDMLINLVNRYAGQFTQQGREKIIFQWLEAIPPQVASHSCVAVYWKGVEALASCKHNATDLFTAAFELAKGKDDTIMFLAWSGLIDSIHIAWGDFTMLDKWICWLDEHLYAHSDFPSGEVECHVAISISWALTIRQPHRSKIIQLAGSGPGTGHRKW